ncbi:MAG TPA: DUF433 domain-containing protein [Pyrinomonadaceae bacterium]|jgi:uncharacterized protein (DUF433 family)|nr:DUF433 domain-containing protein [Pyrinomonadaceae bacterium]
MNDYVQKLENGAYRITGTRISLDSVVYAFLQGESPEQIIESFPYLTLEQAYGGITFYLANKKEIDDYLEQSEIDYQKLRETSQKQNADLIARLKKIRQESHLTHK